MSADDFASLHLTTNSTHRGPAIRDVVIYSPLSLATASPRNPETGCSPPPTTSSRTSPARSPSKTTSFLGHGTYDYRAEYWPSSDVQPFADVINQTTKHVFTSSRLAQTWSHSVVADASLFDYVERLKNSPGSDIGVHGSIRLARDLLASDLVDRLEPARASESAAAKGQQQNATRSPSRRR